MWLRAAGEDIFAVLTRPSPDPPAALRTGVILLQGGSWTPSSGRNRMWANLARSLATGGAAVMRLDYRGVGESSGAIDTYSLDQPFVEEVHAAAAVLRDEGVRSITLLGTCFGARTAMAAAEGIPEVEAVALFPAPVRDFQMGHRLASLPTSWYARKALTRKAWRGWLEPAKRRAYVGLARKKLRRLGDRARGQVDRPTTRFQWVSPLFVDQLSGLVQRQVRVLFVFGDRDDFYDDFRRGGDGALGRVLAAAGDSVTVAEVEGRVHGLTSSAIQERVLGVLDQWLAMPTPAPPAGDRGPAVVSGLGPPP